MKKISGIRTAVLLGLVLSFSIYSISKGEQNYYKTKKTSINIPYLNIRKADQSGLFLLVFDVSQSIWTSDKDYLTEDFKNIYLYLSEQPWAVEHDAILFDEEDKLRSELIKSKRQNIESGKNRECDEIWETNKNTDLKNAFERLDIYLDGVSDKSWIRFVMVSDFYDSTKGEIFENRKRKIDEIVTSFDEDHDWQLYQDYFIFNSPEEENSGYEQYIPPVGTESIIKIGKKLSSTKIDSSGEEKRKFIERVLRGLTGDKTLEWKRSGDIALDNLDQYWDYFVYSDREMNYKDDYLENIVWKNALKSGGYLYHVNGATMKDLKLNRNTNEYYILVMPHIEATMIYTKADNEYSFQEGAIEIKLEIKDTQRDLIQAESFEPALF